MSADGSIEITWGGELRRFRIAIGEFRELQESINSRRVAMGLPPDGPSGLLNALRTKNAWPDDVRDILRLGLIGAGVSRQNATKTMLRIFDNTPLLQHTSAAFLVLLAALVGVPDDEPSKKKMKPGARKTGQLDSQESTEAALQ